jgi:hypothetical protein
MPQCFAADAFASAVLDNPGHAGSARTMWNSVLEELREFVWLAGVVGGLSALGVGLAVAVQLVLVAAA